MIIFAQGRGKLLRQRAFDEPNFPVFAHKLLRARSALPLCRSIAEPTRVLQTGDSITFLCARGRRRTPGTTATRARHARGSASAHLVPTYLESRQSVC